METAQAIGIESYGYLRTVFTQLPHTSSLEEIEALLPVLADIFSFANVS